MTTLETIVRIAWCSLLGLAVGRIFYLVVTWSTRRPRKPIVLNRPLLVLTKTVEHMAKQTDCRSGAVLLCPSDFQLLMRDIRSDNDKIVRSGAGFLIRCYRIMSDKRVEPTSMVLVLADEGRGS